MAESLLTGGSAGARMRIANDRVLKALPESFRQPLADFEAEVNARARLEIDAANRFRQQAEQRLETETAARVSAEGKLQSAIEGESRAKGEAVIAKAAQGAAQDAARDAKAKAAEMHGMHMAECKKREAAETRMNEMQGQLAKAQGEAQAAKEEAARMKREKPMNMPTQKPVAYDVKWADREGRERTMTVTPRS